MDSFIDNIDSDDRKENNACSEDRRDDDDVLYEEGPAVDDVYNEVVEISHNELQWDANEDDINVVECSPPEYESIFDNTTPSKSFTNDDDVDDNNIKSSLTASLTQDDGDSGAGWCVAEKSRKGKIKIRQMGYEPRHGNMTINDETDEERELRLAIEESKRMYALEKKGQRIDVKNDSSSDSRTHTESDIAEHIIREGHQEVIVEDQTDDESIECCFINDDYDDGADEQNLMTDNGGTSCPDNATGQSEVIGKKSLVTRGEDTTSTLPAAMSRGMQCTSKNVKEDKVKGKLVDEVRYNDFELVLLERYNTIEPHRGIDILPATSMGKRKADICLIGSI